MRRRPPRTVEAVSSISPHMVLKQSSFYRRRRPWPGLRWLRKTLPSLSAAKTKGDCTAAAEAVSGTREAGRTIPPLSLETSPSRILLHERLLSVNPLRRPGTSPRSSRRCTYAALFHMDAEHGRDAGGREVRPERTASSCFFRFRSAGRHRTAPSCSCHKISPEYSGLVRERFEFGNIGRYGTAKLACGAFPCYGEKVRRIFTQ